MEQVLGFCREARRPQVPHRDFPSPASRQRNQLLSRNLEGSPSWTVTPAGAGTDDQHSQSRDIHSALPIRCLDAVAVLGEASRVPSPQSHVAQGAREDRAPGWWESRFPIFLVSVCYLTAVCPRVHPFASLVLWYQLNEGAEQDDLLESSSCDDLGHVSRFLVLNLKP